jgi:hypothetical protein
MKSKHWVSIIIGIVTLLLILSLFSTRIYEIQYIVG